MVEPSLPSTSSETVKVKLTKQQKKELYGRPKLAEPVDMLNPMDEPTSSTAKLTKQQKKELYGKTKQYPEPLDTRRSILKDIFANKEDESLKTELLTTIIYEILEVSENPIFCLLELYTATSDFAKEPVEDSLSGAILKISLKWFKKREETMEELRDKFVSSSDKEEAFKSIVKVHVLHLEYVNELYNFEAEDFQSFVIQHIESLVQTTAQFKLAMDTAAAFKLHNHFPYNLFVLPCCVAPDEGKTQGHYNAAKEYLINGQCLEQQRMLIKFFDNLIDRPDDYVHEQVIDSRVVKSKALLKDGKRLVKLVKDLITSFDMQKEQRSFAPRMIFHATLHEMTYNARKRFQNNKINDSCYFQLLKDELKTATAELKKAFIGKLFRLGGCDYKMDAVRWVTYLGISDCQLHEDVVEYISNTPLAVEKAHASIAACEQLEDLNKLMLIDRYPIIWVDNTVGVNELIELFAKSDIIALDSEWKQKPGSISADQISLLQLYLSEKVYLVDFIRLEDVMGAEEWKLFLEALLTGPSIKLGFDLLNDVRAMFAGQHTSPLKYLEDETNNVICLKNLVHNILMLDGEFIKFDRKAVHQNSEINVADGEPMAVHFGLSDLSEKVAKRTLDKSEQCSNWAARPLRKAQMTYAAMDAYVVYEIYELIYKKTSDSQIRNKWDKLLKQSIWNASRKEKAKKNNGLKLTSMNWMDIIEFFSQTSSRNYATAKKPGEVKLIADSNLKGLGKNLRRLGVDVLWPLTDEESVIRLATKLPDRGILTSAASKRQNELCSRFSGRVFSLKGLNEVSNLEATRSVIRQLHIELETKEVFSRCMECNATKFIKAPRPVLQALYESTVIIPNEGGGYPFDLYNWCKFLRGVHPRDYDGIGCEVEVHPLYPDLVNILCHDGGIDILRNLVMHHTDAFPVDTLIRKVPADVIKSRSIPFYYICGGCGKIYWDVIV